MVDAINEKKYKEYNKVHELIYSPVDCRGNQTHHVFL